MKQKLKELWRRDEIDYLIQVALICVFAFGFVYVSGANQTLTEKGCKSYWDKYQPSVNLSDQRLVNTTERKRLQQGLPSKKPEDINYSRTVQ